MPAFVGSCTLGRLALTKHVTHRGASRWSLPWHRLSHHPRHTQSIKMKDKSCSTTEKRQKEYFFKLVSVARNRDKDLLVSVMKSLAKDTDIMQMQPGSRPLPIQDVLLKAVSRCGQVALADNLFKVRQNSDETELRFAELCFDVVLEDQNRTAGTLGLVTDNSCTVMKCLLWHVQVVDLCAPIGCIKLFWCRVGKELGSRTCLCVIL